MKTFLARDIQLFIRLSVKKSPVRKWNTTIHQNLRYIHLSPRNCAVQPYLLADIGEGITECQIIEWHVRPGDRIEQFDKICEVQSDKASVEITSRFDGIVKALHYKTGDMAIVGKPLIDVDIDGDLTGVDEIPAPPSEQNDLKLQEHSNLAMEAAKEDKKGVLGADDQQTLQEVERKLIEPSPELSPVMTKQCKSETAIMTPAVRHLLKELNLEVNNIQGTGRAGRVLKEDVQRHVAATQTSLYISKTTQTASYNARRTSREDKVISLTPIQYQMLRVMTQSLGTPHFLYTHTVNITPLNNFRKRINGNPTLLTSILHLEDKIAKLNPLAFIMKALSEAFSRYPMLNSQLDTQTNAKKAQLILKGSHNFGIAIDTPQGLLVPVIRDVQDHSIVSLAAEIQRISRIAKDGRLGVEDFKGATFAISNIGSIGGGTVSPIILPPMVGIVGIGRVKEVPAFEKDEVGSERIVKREEVVLSWSADHRVLDGATVAKCAEVVGTLLENFEVLGVTLR